MAVPGVAHTTETRLRKRIIMLETDFIFWINICKELGIFEGTISMPIVHPFGSFKYYTRSYDTKMVTIHKNIIMNSNFIISIYGI